MLERTTLQVTPETRRKIKYLSGIMDCNFGEVVDALIEEHRKKHPKLWSGFE